MNDIAVLKKILKHCVSVERSIKRFGDDIDVFAEDEDYQNSVCMNMLQIGELVGNLSDEFKEKHQDVIPWRQIRGLRHIVAHDYSAIDFYTIFEIAHEDLNVLKSFCEQQINEQ